MKNYVTEIIWGLIFFVVALCWMVFEELMGWHGADIGQHVKLTNLFAIVAAIVYIFALRDKKKRVLKGEMSWKQGFKSGVIITAIIVILSPLSQWIDHVLISPDYFSNMAAYMVQEGKLTQEQAEQYFSLDSYMAQSMVIALIMGLMTSALAAFIVRTNTSDASQQAKQPEEDL